MKTNLYRKKDKNGAWQMWIRLNTGEKNDDGTNKKKSYVVNAIEPAIPDALWKANRSGDGEQVEIDISKFSFEEIEIAWKIDAVTTVSGTVLQPEINGIRTELKLKAI